MDFVVFLPLFDRLCDDTPLKINMEAKIITPIEKDNHHPVASILGFNMSIFQGLVTFFFSKVILVQFWWCLPPCWTWTIPRKRLPCWEANRSRFC